MLTWCDTIIMYFCNHLEMHPEICPNTLNLVCFNDVCGRTTTKRGMIHGNRDFIGKHWNRKFIRAVQAVLNSTKGKIGKGVDFFEEAFGRDVDEFMKILWMPETFIIYRRMYDENLRNRLAERYTKHSDNDCDLANEWWAKFSALPAGKLAVAKAIIAMNKFDDGEYECDDPDVEEVLSYYKITRSIAEAEDGTTP